MSRHVDHLGVLRMLHPWDLLLLLSLQQSAQDVRLGDVSTKNEKMWEIDGEIMEISRIYHDISNNMGWAMVSSTIMKWIPYHWVNP